MSVITRTDVTAVKFYKKLVLAGLGSYLNVFEKESAKLQQRIKVLNGQKIYGFVISKCGEKILVFGGKQFTVVTRGSASENTFSSQFEPVVGDDWFLSGVWINENIIAVQTAHNVVQQWNIATQGLITSNPSSNNSILYSGLLLPLRDDLIVFAGTVYSEVIIHCCGDDKPLHKLKGHRGVIFSIACEPKKQIIVTTSDDRSVRIWSMLSDNKYPYDTKEYWEQNLTIESKYEVYGHTARVMRSLIIDGFIVSAGEDSALCFWSHDGVLSKRFVAHQTAVIWSVDADETHLVSGGGDSGIILHPLTAMSYNGHKYTFDAEKNPKDIQFTARKNLVILNAEAELVYYDIKAQFSMSHTLSHVSTFKLMSLSSCKQLIAVTDLYGKLNIFIENCKDAACLRNVIDMKVDVGRVQSLHWAGNRHLIFCNDDGILTLLAAQGTGVEILTKFELPMGREKALTAAAIDTTRKLVVVGDRNGHVHLYMIHKVMPIMTHKKAHGKYGPTSIIIKEREIVTTGRDGTVTYFSIDKNLAHSKYLRCKELEFKWPEKFLDRDETLICGFQERQFVVYNFINNMKILEVPCGGGHRCWDAVRYLDKIKGKYEEIIKIVYLKNSMIFVYTFELSKIVSKMITNGSQGREINCLKNWTSNLDPSLNFFFTGGEDTTFRVSSLNSELHFEDISLYKQLSNVKALKVYPVEENKLLVVSGGGRAQLCINSYTFEKDNDHIKVISRDLGDYTVQGLEDGPKPASSWRFASVDLDPETRVMDIDAIMVAENRFIILAGCSDSFLRVFLFADDPSYSPDPQFRLLLDVQRHPTCILKTVHIEFKEHMLFVTCTTRGYITFWIIINKERFYVEPFFDLHPFKSGINAFAYKIVENAILIASGGDDTVISLDLIAVVQDETVTEKLSLKAMKSLKVAGLHCSQITGIIILDHLLVSTSIDQRITVCQIKVQLYGIECEFLKQVFSDIADIQGLDLVEHNKEENFIKVCVFGKGMEIVKIDLSKE